MIGEMGGALGSGAGYQVHLIKSAASRWGEVGTAGRACDWLGYPGLWLLGLRVDGRAVGDDDAC